MERPQAMKVRLPKLAQKIRRYSHCTKRSATIPTSRKYSPLSHKGVDSLSAAFFQIKSKVTWRFGVEFPVQKKILLLLHVRPIFLLESMFFRCDMKKGALDLENLFINHEKHPRVQNTLTYSVVKASLEFFFSLFMNSLISQKTWIWVIKIFYVQDQ